MGPPVRLGSEIRVLLEQVRDRLGQQGKVIEDELNQARDGYVFRGRIDAYIPIGAFGHCNGDVSCLSHEAPFLLAL
jgi:hypothetical protein